MQPLMEQFFAPEVRPFAVAAMMIVIVGGIEVVSMIIGFSLSEIIGSAFHVHIHLNSDDEGHSGIGHAMSWINSGGVPLLVFILIVLAYFSMGGFLVQGIAGGIAAPLPVWMASAAAIVLALPLVRETSRLIARAIPKDESYAVSDDDLVGCVGDVMIGPLDSGLPGRVRVADVYGNFHFVAAIAAPESPPLPQGASVLLVDRNDERFVAIATTDDLKPSRNL